VTPDRILVVGNQPSAVNAAVTWLQVRGMKTVGAPTPWRVLTNQEIAEQTRELNAQVVVWVLQSGDLRAPMVSVRGIDTETQAVIWSGLARTTKYGSTPPVDRIVILTCNALEAAWGDRAANDRQSGFRRDCE
jgi:hypothetical protein